MTSKSITTAKDFLSAFKSLRKSQRDEFLRSIATDRALRQDLLDLATIAERRTERSRPFREYLAERRLK